MPKKRKKIKTLLWLYRRNKCKITLKNNFRKRYTTNFPSIVMIGTSTMVLTLFSIINHLESLIK